jgi:hypothetical protein
MRYVIVTGESSVDLEQKVNKHLREGWELVGGVCIEVTTMVAGFGTVINTIYYFQAMVLK